MTRVAGGNPAFKVYDIDPDTFEIMDARTYMSEHLIVATMFFFKLIVVGSNAANISDPMFQLHRK